MWVQNMVRAAGKTWWAPLSQREVQTQRTESHGQWVLSLEEVSTCQWDQEPAGLLITFEYYVPEFTSRCPFICKVSVPATSITWRVKGMKFIAVDGIRAWHPKWVKVQTKPKLARSPMGQTLCWDQRGGKLQLTLKEGSAAETTGAERWCCSIERLRCTDILGE